MKSLRGSERKPMITFFDIDTCENIQRKRLECLHELWVFEVFHKHW